MDRLKKLRYNDDWSATSTLTRVRRAKNRCELCKIENDFIGRRSVTGTWRAANADELKLIKYYQAQLNYKLPRAIKIVGLKKVVLSVAHLNHNERDDRPENLLCACQWCHLKHDRLDNWQRRKRQNRTIKTQMLLF